MDLQEKRRLDVAGQVAKVRRRAHPWRSIIALVIALAGAVAVVWKGVSFNAPEGIYPGKVITIAGALAFALFGLAAVFGLSAKARSALEPAVGSSHASVVRYALVLVGAITVILITLNLLGVSVGKLIVGTALTGILIGIAAQQALSNVFAGMVLMFARPFTVGDRVRIRSGAFSGTMEGTVVEISITYVRLDTSEGLLSLPNSQVLASAVGRPPAPPATLAAAQPADPLAGQQPGPADGQAGSRVAGPGGGAAQPASGPAEPAGPSSGQSS